MEEPPVITLVLGGNKSGKSDFALELAARSGHPMLFIATGKARDLEFRAQINRHRLDRGPETTVFEVDRDLPQALINAKPDFPTVLVDSLDYWLFSIREAGCEQASVEEFLDTLRNWDGPDLVLVSCETGLGPLPAGSAIRAFVRSLGALNQETARLADAVHLVAAGLPLTLKKG